MHNDWALGYLCGPRTMRLCAAGPQLALQHFSTQLTLSQGSPQALLTETKMKHIWEMKIITREPSVRLALYGMFLLYAAEVVVLCTIDAHEACCRLPASSEPPVACCMLGGTFNLGFEPLETCLKSI